MVLIEVPSHNDPEEPWYCLFCGQVIREASLAGEVEWWPSQTEGIPTPQYTTFAAHPKCFMEAAHQSIRDEGYFDPETFLPRTPPT